MSAAVMASPLPGSDSRVAIDPTIVTSSPSRIHTVPSPMRIRQWNRDHGNRSNRDGTRVSILCTSTSALMREAYPGAPGENADCQVFVRSAPAGGGDDGDMINQRQLADVHLATVDPRF